MNVHLRNLGLKLQIFSFMCILFFGKCDADLSIVHVVRLCDCTTTSICYYCNYYYLH